ncbi:hypothetical protein EW145_g655 [Phellinidium pouzarii]|uniref:RRM domain-containing protein n=1 Tax=Phellinidium pouzarii TaxID=167371 RepID=A0A4S4LN18_9AGAM|nr:hypothetical protein EW145_g655 [Phellinidium pouzarii]
MILGGTRQTPIVIDDDDDDDDDCAQPYRPTPGILTRARMNQARDSENNFEKDIPSPSGWKQPGNNEIHNRDSFPLRQPIGGADTESETVAFPASQMEALETPASNPSQSLKRKRSFEDTLDTGHLPRPAFAVETSAIADGRSTSQSSVLDPFAGLSKTQRKKLRKRMRAEEAVASHAKSLPQAKMLPAEAILGYTVQHRTNEAPFEHATYDRPSWPGRSLPGSISQVVSSAQSQSPVPGSHPAPSTSYFSRPTEPVALGVSGSVSKETQLDMPSYAYFPLPVQEHSFQPTRPSEFLIIQSTKPPDTSAFGPNLFAAKSRIIGNFASLGSGHGLFPLAPDQYVSHDPGHTLIMEGMPKRFRTLDFVLQWCRDTGTNHDPAPLHIDVTRKLGKALIEFSTRERAIRAFNSPKLINKDGREQINLYWYRPESSLPLPTHLPLPVRAPSTILPPPSSPQSMQLSRSLEPRMIASNLQPTKKLEDMEEGEIDEVIEVSENGIQALPTGCTLQWSPGRSNHWVLSTGLTPLWDFPENYHDSIKPSGRSPQWTPELKYSRESEDFVTGKSPRSQHESERGGLRASEPANMFVEESSTHFSHTESFRDAISGNETLEPKNRGSVAVFAEACSSTLTESSPAKRLAESGVTDMEVDSKSITSPFFSASPSHDTYRLPRDLPSVFSSSENTNIVDDGLDEHHILPVARSINYEEEKENRNRQPIKIEGTHVESLASSAAPEQVENVADRLSELRQRVLASKKKKLETAPVPVASLARATAPSISTKKAGIILDATRSNTPSDFSTGSTTSNDSLFSRTSAISTTTTSSISMSSDSTATVTKSASYFDTLATAFLQDIIGSDKPSPAANDHERTVIDRASIDSKTVLLNKQKRLDQHITKMKQLMAQLSSTTKKIEKDKLMRTIRETERAFNADNSAADAALKRMATATRSKNGLSTPWPQTRWDQMVLVVSDSEDGGYDSGDDE